MARLSLNCLVAMSILGVYTHRIWWWWWGRGRCKLHIGPMTPSLLCGIFKGIELPESGLLADYIFRRCGVKWLKGHNTQHSGHTGKNS